MCDDDSKHRIWLTNVDSKCKVRMCNSCKVKQDKEATTLFRIQLLVKRTAFLGLSKPCNLYVKAYLHQVHRQKRLTPICDKDTCTRTGEASWEGLPSSAYSIAAKAASGVINGVDVGDSIDSTDHGLVFPSAEGTLLEFFADPHAEHLVVELWEQAPLRATDIFAGTCTIPFDKGIAMPASIQADTKFAWPVSKKLRPRSSKDSAVRACNLEMELRVRPPLAFLRKRDCMVPVAHFHRIEALKSKDTLSLATSLWLYKRIERYCAQRTPAAFSDSGDRLHAVASRCVQFLLPPFSVGNSTPKLTEMGSGIGATTPVRSHATPWELLHNIWGIAHCLRRTAARLGHIRTSDANDGGGEGEGDGVDTKTTDTEAPPGTEDATKTEQERPAETETSENAGASTSASGGGRGGGPPPLPSRDSLKARIQSPVHATMPQSDAESNAGRLRCGAGPVITDADMAECEESTVSVEAAYAAATQRDAQLNASRALSKFPELTQVCYSIDVSKLTARQRVIHEIFTSEKTYLDALYTLNQLYAQPLSRAADGLRLQTKTVGASGAKSRTKGRKKTTSEVRKEQRKMLQTPELKVLLSSIEAIVETNTELMRSMLGAVNGWQEPILMGGVFSSLGHFFKQYDTFAAAHHKAVECLSSSSFKEFVLKCQHSEEAEVSGGADFKTLLIGPVQRVMRYRMLLQSLADNTEPDHPDHAELQSALATINVACDHVNEHVRKTENKEKIMEVAAKLTGLPAGFSMLQEGRTLVKEGVLSKVCRKTNKPFHVVLCNDVLIYGSRYTHGIGNHATERICFHRLIQVRT